MKWMRQMVDEKSECRAAVGMEKDEAEGEGEGGTVGRGSGSRFKGEQVPNRGKICNCGAETEPRERNLWLWILGVQTTKHDRWLELRGLVPNTYIPSLLGRVTI